MYVEASRLLYLKLGKDRIDCLHKYKKTYDKPKLQGNKMF